MRSIYLFFRGIWQLLAQRGFWSDKWHIGRCPFHEERTASFVTNKDTGEYMCFGCGVKGLIQDINDPINKEPISELTDHGSYSTITRKKRI